MLVTCEKCSSRYQIADDKIKATGTKVRCPRCQHTFRVFQQAAPSVPKPAPRPDPIPQPARTPPPPRAPAPQAPEPQASIPGLNDSTEYFERSQDSIRQTAQKASAPESKPMTTGRPRPSFSPLPDERISAQDFIDRPASKPVKDPSPFKKPPQPTFDMDEILRSSSVSENSEADQVSDEGLFNDSEESSNTAAPRKRSVADQAPAPSEPPKPFGDATFFALQQMSKSSKVSSRKLIIAALVVVIAAAGFFVLTQSPSQKPVEIAQPNLPATPQTKLAFDRPAQWYKDDPSVFQDFLAQNAARPAADQKKPESRALVAEALILNGLLNGADDQIASGLGMASSLIAAHPNAVYGYYALSTYAQWRDDIQTLSELVQKWPADRRAEPEYRLSQIIVDAHSKEAPRALEASKAFLMDQPDNRRAQTLIYSLYLDAPEEIQKQFGDRLVQEIQKTYQKLRLTYGPNASLPPILKSIDKKIARRNLAAQAAPAPKPQEATAPSEMSVTQKLNERSLQRLEERRKKLISEAQSAPKPQEAKVPPPVKKVQDPKKLPKASNELMAMNRETKREKSEAERIFEQAHDLQKSNHLEEAIGLYQKALRLNPDFADVYRNLGEIYMNRQEKERALRNFKIYLQLKPQSQDKQMVEGWISSLQ